MPGPDPQTTRQILDTNTDLQTRVGPGRIENPFAAFPSRNDDLSRLIHDQHVKRMMRIVERRPQRLQRPHYRVLALLLGGLRRALR